MYTTDEIQRMARMAPGGQFVYVRVGPHLDATDPDRPNREGLVQVPGATIARFELAGSARLDAETVLEGEWTISDHDPWHEPGLRTFKARQ